MTETHNIQKQNCKHLLANKYSPNIPLTYLQNKKKNTYGISEKSKKVFR